MLVATLDNSRHGNKLLGFGDDGVILARREGEDLKQNYVGSTSEHQPEERRCHLSEPSSEGVGEPGVPSIAGEEGGDEVRGQLEVGRGKRSFPYDMEVCHCSTFCPPTTSDLKEAAFSCCCCSCRTHSHGRSYHTQQRQDSTGDSTGGTHTRQWGYSIPHHPHPDIVAWLRHLGARRHVYEAVHTRLAEVLDSEVELMLTQQLQ